MQIRKEKGRRSICFVIPAIMLLLCSCGNNFFTQFYEFPRLSKKQLIAQINCFKRENPQYKLIHLNS
ncbi:MAG: hypothetical protein LBU62_08975, partial [Bacteroidales bacterium]|nr:hypothetical protein [Bacteroidales bacterium]